MLGVSLGACVPNLRCVSLATLELLAFNIQQFMGSLAPNYAPFWKIRGLGFKEVQNWENATETGGCPYDNAAFVHCQSVVCIFSRHTLVTEINILWPCIKCIKYIAHRTNMTYPV